ncbi:MAG: dihydroneopterin aldolase [Bacteroidaceae bacterium]|nr:dihydroneopterin aldolase [Bacteroidaceae bacterium]
MKIKINRQKVYAYHGVLPQERKVGSYFYVTTSVETPLETSLYSDKLSDTLSYADIATVVNEEMAIASQLLEHVAQRIATRLLGEYAELSSVTVEIIKENPPLGIESSGTGIEITLRK